MNTNKLTLSALFAALTCLATMVIRIAIPATNGYIHLGDCMVILSGICLGPVYGVFAAGIGSAMADFLGGYMIYIPITFVVKGLMAFAAAIIFHKLADKVVSPALRTIFSGLACTLLLVLGYFVFEYPMYGSAAIVSIIPNLIQGLSGLVLSSLLVPSTIRIMARIKK